MSSGQGSIPLIIDNQNDKKQEQDGGSVVMLTAFGGKKAAQATNYDSITEEQQPPILYVDQNGNPIDPYLPQQPDIAKKNDLTMSIFCCYGLKYRINAVYFFFTFVSIVAIGSIIKWIYLIDFWLEFSVISIIVSGSAICSFVILGILYANSKNKCLGTFNIIYSCMVFIILLFFLICTCFSADSVVWIKKSNDMNVIRKMSLRDIEIGDYVLTMDPFTNEIFWDEVLLRIHYSWYDDGNDYYLMRKLYLQNNKTCSSITLSDDHFIFIVDDDDNNGINNNAPKVIQTELVNIGDRLFYYDDSNYNIKSHSQSLMTVFDIEENVKSQKRVFFTIKPYVLVNNIVASPYIGPHPIYHTILHKIFTNMIFIRHISTQFILSSLSLCGYFAIYISYFMFVHWIECVFMFITLVFVYCHPLTQKK